MVSFSLKEVLEATGGRLLQGGEIRFEGVSTDSRKIRGGELFFALRGERRDGHDFVPEAIRKGASGAVIHKETPGVPLGRPLILVRDTLFALGELARWWRKKCSFTLVAITGSVGKTTTKEMLAGILASEKRVGKSPGNYNNLIGVPLSLLQMDDRVQVAVLELGMNRSGEIKRLSEISQPQIGVITGIGPVHLEGLGDVEAVKEAKGELLSSIEDGFFVYNADDPRTRELASRFRGRKVSFGLSPFAEYRASEIDLHEGLRFNLYTPRGRLSLKLRLLGEHFVWSALAASACADLLGIGLDGIRRGLEGFRPLPMRMELRTIRGVNVINDAYNANPASMEAALKALSSRKGRKFALLGDMAELGSETERLHRELGEFCAHLPLEGLFLLGEQARTVAEGARKRGMEERKIVVARDHREIAHALAQRVREGDWLLVKGSRIMATERVIEIWEEISGGEGA